MHKYVYYMLDSNVVFEWDLVKELQNVKKHGIDFTQATEVFIDPKVIHLEDESHSQKEKRLYAVGRDSKGNIITVRYTTRGRNIRLIGAAKWRKWRRFYGKNT